MYSLIYQVNGFYKMITTTALRDEFKFQHTHNIVQDVDKKITFEPIENIRNGMLLTSPAVYVWVATDQVNNEKKRCLYVGKTGIGVKYRFKNGHEPGFKNNVTGRDKAKKIQVELLAKRKIQVFTRRSEEISLFKDQKIKVNGCSIEEEYFIQKFNPEWNIALVKKGGRKLFADFSGLLNYSILEEFMSNLKADKKKKFLEIIKKIEDKCANSFTWEIIKRYSNSKIKGRGPNNIPCLVYGPKKDKAGKKQKWLYRFYLTEDLKEIYTSGAKRGRVNI